MAGNLPRFISEKDVTERRLKDAAEGKTEEPYDPRPLYDRLQAERNKKQEEYEAASAFKNQIHRLDPDEAAFLAKIDQQRSIAQDTVDQEANLLIQEAKAANRSNLLKAAAPPERSPVTQKFEPTRYVKSNSLDQKRLLAGLKRKGNPPANSNSKKPHTDSPTEVAEVNNTPKPHSDNSSPAQSHPIQAVKDTKLPEARVFSGYLPGLVPYGGPDSDSSNSSDSDDSTDVEDSVVTLSSVALTRGKQTSHGSENE